MPANNHRSDDDYDYVIVGAGAAGCVMAYRLSANPATRVLLLEAGPPDSSPYIHMPKGLGKVMMLPRYVWPYLTNAHAALNHAGEVWARGKTLGGSSAINGMMYVRGQPADYDEVERVAGPEWGWAKIGAAYRELENHELGAGPTRGDQGPLHVTMPKIRTQLTEAMIEAGVAMGLPRKLDVNQPDDTEAVGYAATTIYRGKRESAAVAFLKPIRSRPNLAIETNVVVDKVMINGRRVVGALASQNGIAKTFRARREVLVAAGALASPVILQRSGIGPAALLSAHNIPIVVGNDHVGAHLREHRALVMQWRIPDHTSLNAEHLGGKLFLNLARYYMRHRGVLAAATYEVGAWFKTRPEFDRPDGQFLLAPYSFDFSLRKPGVESFGGMHICAYVLRPESTGSVMIRSTDPKTLAAIVPNFRNTESDCRAMVDVVRYARKYVQQAPLASLIKAETRPGSEYQTDEQIIAAYDKFGSGAYHASGTCRMGLDAESVVDERLRVRGVDGLRVVDTSILPFLVAGNTNGPAMAMSWRAADLILAEH
jgi:choline dehydrogenase